MGDQLVHDLRVDIVVAVGRLDLGELRSHAKPGGSIPVLGVDVCQCLVARTVKRGTFQCGTIVPSELLVHNPSRLDVLGGVVESAVHGVEVVSELLPLRLARHYATSLNSMPSMS